MSLSPRAAGTQFPETVLAHSMDGERLGALPTVVQADELRVCGKWNYYYYYYYRIAQQGLAHSAEPLR